MHLKNVPVPNVLRTNYVGNSKLIISIDSLTDRIRFIFPEYVVAIPFSFSI
jgi:hypothetical protein